jgi:tRNA(fMet)-specific endonuclease VapC
MGLILDSSVVIGVERRGQDVAELLDQVTSVAGDQRVALSSEGLTELVHALYRSKNPFERSRHERFLHELLAIVEVIPYTRETAFLAGKIDGEQRALGNTIPSMDLFIGVTALEIGYSLVTVNLRHFKRIPGLDVIAL